MSTDLPVVPGNAEAATEFLSQNKVQRVQVGGNFLRFEGKRAGEWLFGPEGEPCDGDIFALKIPSLKHGYILWHNQKADKRLVPINQPMPEPQEEIRYEDENGDPKVDRPSVARAFEGVFEDGVEFSFETSSVGGAGGLDNFLAELFTRARAGNPYLFPMIRLDSDSYPHSKYGTIFVPVFTAVGWFNAEGEPDPTFDSALLEGPEDGSELQEAPKQEEEPKEEPKKTTRRRQAAKNDDAPAAGDASQHQNDDAPQEQAGTTRRRRRRSA